MHAFKVIVGVCKTLFSIKRFMVQRSPTQTGPAAQIHNGNDIIIMTHRGGCSGSGMLGKESSGERRGVGRSRRVNKKDSAEQLSVLFFKEFDPQIGKKKYYPHPNSLWCNRLKPD